MYLHHFAPTYQICILWFFLTVHSEGIDKHKIVLKIINISLIYCPTNFLTVWYELWLSHDDDFNKSYLTFCKDSENNCFSSQWSVFAASKISLYSWIGKMNVFWVKDMYLRRLKISRIPGFATLLGSRYL